MKTECMESGMRRRLNGILVMAVGAMLAVGLAAGCSSSSGSPAAKGTGGSTGSGGAAVGSGGAAVGSGGASAGSGGSSSVSDGGGTDAHAAEPLGTFTVADDLQGFSLNPYSDPNNLGDPTRDGGALATLSWDGVEGTPDKGALKVQASYSQFGQFFIAYHDFSDLDVRDWTGRKLHVSVKIATGNDVGRAVKVFVQDQIAGVDGGAATYPYADQYFMAAPGADWQEFTFDVLNATYKSAEWTDLSITQVRLFGVNVDAGIAPTDTDAGVVPAAATVYIDNIWLE